MKLKTLAQTARGARSGAPWARVATWQRQQHHAESTGVPAHGWQAERAGGAPFGGLRTVRNITTDSDLRAPGNKVPWLAPVGRGAGKASSELGSLGGAGESFDAPHQNLSGKCGPWRARFSAAWPNLVRSSDRPRAASIAGFGRISSDLQPAAGTLCGMSSCRGHPPRPGSLAVLCNPATHSGLLLVQRKVILDVSAVLYLPGARASSAALRASGGPPPVCSSTKSYASQDVPFSAIKGARRLRPTPCCRPFGGGR